MGGLTLSGPLSSKLLVFLGGGLQWQQLRKHLTPPPLIPILCLSRCWTMTVSWLAHEASTRLKRHFPLWHLRRCAEPREHNQELTPVITACQVWTDDWLFLTYYDSPLEPESRNNKRRRRRAEETRISKEGACRWTLWGHAVQGNLTECFKYSGEFIIWLFCSGLLKKNLPTQCSMSRWAFYVFTDKLLRNILHATRTAIIQPRHKHDHTIEDGDNVRETNRLKWEG